MNQPFQLAARGILPIVLALATLPAPASASEVRTTAGDEVAQITDLSDLGIEVIDNQAQLTLEDAIAAALRRNLSLVVERYRRSQTILGIQEALGIYDFDLSATGGTSESTSPVTSELQLADLLTDEGQRLNLSASRLTPFGGTATLDFNNSRFKTSDQRAIQNPRFDSTLQATFSQPLLRDFGRAVTEQAIVVARTNSAISREDFQFQVQLVVQEIADRYWLLVEAREQLAVAQESLALAEELHEMNRIQVEVGTMAPLEMVQSEAGVATREEEIIRRQAAVEDSADQLRRLVNLDRRELWNIGIVPVTEPEIEHRPIDVGAAIDTALEYRPDVRRMRLDIRNRELEARVAKNQARPRLDVQAQFGYSGVGGDVTSPATGDLIPGGYSDALQQIIDGDFDGWSLGFSFGYPLRNRAAKARLAQADLALEQIDVELRDLEQQVLADVRQAARAVETAAKQIESAKVSSKLQRKNLEAERKRYENGLSTSFEVLQIQEDLSEARSREVSAVTSYRRALTAYQLAIGKLLEENYIELADDGGEG